MSGAIPPLLQMPTQYAQGKILPLLYSEDVQFEYQLAHRLS
jgi:hypothetical protein